MKRNLLFISLIILCSSCLRLPSKRLNKDIKELISNQDLLSNSLVGLQIEDLKTGEVIFSQHATKYFTPASNTKILTFYTGLMTFGDQYPRFKYQETGDTIFFSPLGDPTFFHPTMSDGKEREFFSKDKTYAFVEPYFETPKYGSGWSWDDLGYAFAREKSSFPIWANVLNIQDTAAQRILIPEHFEILESDSTNAFSRASISNSFYLPPIGRDRDLRIPYITSDSIALNHLSKELGEITRRPSRALNKTYYGVPSDSIYQELMQESDNFLSEQLLITASGLLTDTLSTELAINFMQENHLNDFPDPFIWVDGSGISRYNMFTPRSVIELLRRIERKIGMAKVKVIFPIGGVAGTIKNWYGAEEPFVYAKTGTIRHNHSLSGFLLTDSGKTLVFSLNVNHYPTSSSKVKEQIQRLLFLIKANG